MRARGCLIGASVLALVWSAPSLAQTPPADPGASTEQAESPSTDQGEVIVTARRRNENLQTTPLSASVLIGHRPRQQGRRPTSTRCSSRRPVDRREQFRPGHRLQRPRHRQGRAQHPDRDRRHHLPRRRADLPRLFPGRALLRRRQHPGAARAAGHDRRPERDRRRGVRQLERPDHRRRLQRLHQCQRRQLFANSARRARSTCR